MQPTAEGLIYLSSVNVFDDVLDRPHYEGDVRAYRNGYGQFKIRCEDLLRERLGDRAIILRTPFVWGRGSPRVREIAAGCKAGQLHVYKTF